MHTTELARSGEGSSMMDQVEWVKAWRVGDRLADDPSIQVISHSAVTRLDILKSWDGEGKERGKLGGR
jgi:hypothetical protein